MAKSEIFLAGLVQNCAGEKKSSSCLDCSRIIMPKKWREQPGPSKRFSRGQGIGRNRAVLENRSFNRNGTALNQIEAVGRLARAENNLAFLKLPEGCTTGQKFDMMRAHPSKERMSHNKSFDMLLFRIHYDSLN